MENWQEKALDEIIVGDGQLVNFELLLRTYDLEKSAEKIVEASYSIEDLLKKDALDRLLDFVFKKTQTGYADIMNLAYPTMRMLDKELEEKIIELINVHLYPEIIFKILKIFTRNIHDPDSNLNMAYLINSDEIIRSVYDTFQLFRDDIFKSDEAQRVLNVKRIQQFSPHSDNSLSSPLDASARLKYILEFFALNRDVSTIYTLEDIKLAPLKN